MRRAAFVLILGLVMVILVVGLLGQSLLVMQRLAAVSDAKGTVEIQPPRQDAFQPLGDTDHVTAGTIVRTGNDGEVTLSWVDGSRVRLSRNTTMRVLKCQMNQGTNSETYLFKLDMGKIWIRVLKRLSQRSRFEVRTPAATAAVRGTVFSVAVQRQGTTEVSVLKGQVALETQNKQLIVREDQMTEVGHQAHSAVLEQTPEERKEWEKARSVAQPALELLEPESTTIPAGTRAVTVRGDAERGAKVTVNGEPVDANDLTGKFETQVLIPTDAETFEITVRAEDRKGFSKAIVKRLRR